ncbi:alcohol oxidase [Lentinula edodes]|uniref:Alcohol oxidase n=1 Tax=Lentinula edodes TaxID=5353 RepID=A0A1Q3E042_LENED|nr:alcohol oxidase [Lentinula edodes]
MFDTMVLATYRSRTYHSSGDGIWLYGGVVTFHDHQLSSPSSAIPVGNRWTFGILDDDDIVGLVGLIVRGQFRGFQTVQSLSAYGVNTDPILAHGQSFDYIVVGGGLAGTTVAARLAENSEVTVLLVEAGSDNRTDEIVYDIYAYSQAFGTDLDWEWPTDQGKTMRGGKTLGGSTSINGAHYTRGMQAQYDAWTTLLETSDVDAGWNWEGIFGYMQKSEAFSAPNSQQAAKGAESSLIPMLCIEHCPDVNGGASNCVSMTPLTIDWHDTSCNSNYLIEHRKPLKEIIVAAGAIQSPALLQLSGIGDSSLLNSLDIGTNLDMKGVGRNLQEQTMNSLGAGGNFDYGGEGPSDCIAYPNIYQVFGWNETALQVAVDQLNDSSVRSSWAASQSASADSQAALEKNYEVQAGLILNGNAPIVELFYDTGFPDDIGIDLWQLLPFSRGNVSITTSSEPRRIIASPPLSSLSTGETVPGTRVVPNTNGNFGSDQDWKSWILDPSAGFAAVNHAIGTAPMMRQELGGVVDAQLKIYNTTNVRVVDASILPMQLSAHLSATLYGVAEKAADIIKASN